MQIIPKSIDSLIEDFSRLPGIGPKSAARIVFFLLRAPGELSKGLGDGLIHLKEEIGYCSECYNYSQTSLCDICASEGRDGSKIMVVEDPLDIVALERAGVYTGKYHVLGGVLSPMNGIGPDEVRIKELLVRLKKMDNDVELILAVNPDMQGESTALYIQNEINQQKDLTKLVKITKLARGLSSGADIDYADEFTLRRAYEGREGF